MTNYQLAKLIKMAGGLRSRKRVSKDSPPAAVRAPAATSTWTSVFTTTARTPQHWPSGST